MMTIFYEFRQNNSGGVFNIDDAAGIGPRVWIEAKSKDEAISRALDIGVYFDGVHKGIDCPCCGDRWSKSDCVGEYHAPELDQEYDFIWHDTVYVHNLDGTISRLKAQG